MEAFAQGIQYMHCEECGRAQIPTNDTPYSIVRLTLVMAWVVVVGQC